MTSTPSLSRDTAQELMTRLADGDRSAFDPLFDLLWPAVRRFAVRLLGEPEGEDAAQEALLRVFSRASEFDPRRDALPWVFGIAYWQCRTHRRKASRAREETLSPIVAERAADGSDHEAQLLAAEALEAAGRVLGEVTEQDRETLLAAAGLTHRPLVSAAAFRKRLQRARRRLRSILGARHGTL